MRQWIIDEKDDGMFTTKEFEITQLTQGQRTVQPTGPIRIWSRIDALLGYIKESMEKKDKV